jgi:CheY-like chemotaxis protein
MPVLDGRAALDLIRERPELVSLPVIAVTASSPVGDEATLRSHFSGFIRKPFSRQTLFLELGRYLQRVPRKGLVAERHLDQELSAVPPRPERTIQWRAVVQELRRLEEGEWRSLCESLAINAITAFADLLRTLGNASDCSLLVSYASRLGLLASTYAVGELEAELARFPKLIEVIEAACEQETKA